MKLLSGNNQSVPSQAPADADATQGHFFLERNRREGLSGSEALWRKRAWTRGKQKNSASIDRAFRLTARAAARRGRSERTRRLGAAEQGKRRAGKARLAADPGSTAAGPFPAALKLRDRAQALALFFQSGIFLRPQAELLRPTSRCGRRRSRRFFDLPPLQKTTDPSSRPQTPRLRQPLP